MQELLRIINSEASSRKEELTNAWKTLSLVPRTNLFRRTEHLTTDHQKFGDNGLYDLLLHKQDQAFSFSEVMHMIKAAGLHFVGLAEPDKRLKMNYNWQIKDESLKNKLAALEPNDQLSIGEILSGDFIASTRLYS